MENTPPVARRSKLLRSAWRSRPHATCYGGIDNLSVPRLSLLRRQAASLVECELIEARMSEGNATPDDIDRHTRIVGNVRRCYEVLGMDRLARDVGPVTVSDYLEAKAAE
jgi:hypothetical protein